MTTIAPDRPKIDVKPGFQGFVELAEAVGLHLEPFQRKIAKAALGPERELLVLIARVTARLSCKVSSRSTLSAERASIRASI
jgi:hypothetical protein